MRAGKWGELRDETDRDKQIPKNGQREASTEEEKKRKDVYRKWAHILK